MMSSSHYRLSKTFHAVHADCINQIAVSPNNRYFATASDDKTVAVFDLSPSSFLTTTPVGLIRRYAPAEQETTALAWDQDNRFLFVGLENGQICTYSRPLASTVSSVFTLWGAVSLR